MPKMPTKLTEDMVVARTKISDLSSVKKFNCWGSELSDISVIRRFGNVEVLSLSLNNISTLADFQFCHKLVELYVRRNDIRDLSEICYLQELPRLRRLLLSENPCVDTAGHLYRVTVLRALPNLEILDSVAVTPEEVEIAMKTGLLLEHPLAVKERSPEPIYYDPESPVPVMVHRNSAPSDDEPGEYTRSPNNQSQQMEYYYQNESQVAMKSEDQTTPKGSLSLQNNNRQLVNGANASRRDSGISPNSSDSQSQHSGSPPTSSCINLGDTTQRQVVSPDNGYRERGMVEGLRNGRRQPEYASDYERGQQYYEPELSRRTQGMNVTGRNESSKSRQRTKVAMTSNLLSAVLCLIPELDWDSLNVVELAIRRRIDEINSD